MTGAVVWLTGRPSSGKSTLARAAAERLRASGHAAVVLDGDAVRAALHPSPAYDEASRADFYASLADLAALVAEQGPLVLVPATANRAAYRARARAAARRFVEVFVDTPLEECARRDDKGLYARAAAGGAPTMPGVGVGYEVPASPDVRLHGAADDVERLVAACAGLAAEP